MGGPGVYYGGYWGSPLSCTFNLPAGEEFELIVEQYGWGSETSVDVTKPDGTTDSFGPYYFSSYTTYDPLETYDVAGQYTIVLDDTWGDGGAKVTADYASDAEEKLMQEKYVQLAVLPGIQDLDLLVFHVPFLMEPIGLHLELSLWN